MAERVTDLQSGIVQAFDNVIKREDLEKAEVRKEVETKGTNWAGDEIWSLRRQVASLRKKLAEKDAGEIKP
jgi:hypothetical protein